MPPQTCPRIWKLCSIRSLFLSSLQYLSPAFSQLFLLSTDIHTCIIFPAYISLLVHSLAPDYPHLHSSCCLSSERALRLGIPSLNTHAVSPTPLLPDSPSETLWPSFPFSSSYTATVGSLWLTFAPLSGQWLLYGRGWPGRHFEGGPVSCHPAHVP